MLTTIADLNLLPPEKTPYFMASIRRELLFCFKKTFLKFKMLRCVAPLTFVFVCTLLPIDACMGGSSSQTAQSKQGGFQNRQVRW